MLALYTEHRTLRDVSREKIKAASLAAKCRKSLNGWVKDTLINLEQSRLHTNSFYQKTKQHI